MSVHESGIDNMLGTHVFGTDNLGEVMSVHVLKAS